MEVIHWKECPDQKIDKFPYKEKINEVIGTSVRWLSKHGDDGNGYPEYGLAVRVNLADGVYTGTAELKDGPVRIWPLQRFLRELAAGQCQFIPSGTVHSRPGSALHNSVQ